MNSKGFDDLQDKIRALLEQHQGSSLKEANELLAGFMLQRNSAPIDDFHGLSSEAMHRFIHFPFDSPKFVEIPDVLNVVPADAPIARLFDKLATAIGPKGIKTTATGNLPRNLVREIALAMMSTEEHAQFVKFRGIQSENDYQALNTTRRVAQVAGLIRKVTGRFTLTKACQKLLARDGMKAVYPRLLRTHVTKYNWAFGDLWTAAPFIQHGFVYSLYVLERFGGDWQPPSLYEDAFIRAFPQVISDFDDEAYPTPERSFRACYSLRTVERFFGFLGLAELHTEDNLAYDKTVAVRKTSLLADAVRFHLEEPI